MATSARDVDLARVPDTERAGSETKAIDGNATRAGTKGRGSDRPLSRRDFELPIWFVGGLAALVTWWAAAGVVAVLLLFVGWYTSAVTVVSASAAAVVVGGLVVRRLDSGRRAAHGCALAAVGLAVAFAVFAGAFHSEHVLADRDPAIYIGTGRSIARTHEWNPTVLTGPFSNEARYSPDAGHFQVPAFTVDANGRQDQLFFPMLPSMLAVAWSFGGDTGMLLLPALLGAMGVLACYALASRVLGPGAGLVAPVLLVLAPFQLWFSRDAYSELVVQAVVLSGLWLYLEARARSAPSVAFAAGALFGSSVFAHVDALALVASAFALIALDWVRSSNEATPANTRRVIATFTMALIVVSVAGRQITYKMSHRYIVMLGGLYREMMFAAAAALLALVAVLVIHRLRPGLGRWLVAQRWIPIGLTVLAGAGFAWAYWLRPESKALPTNTLDSGAAFNDWHWSRSLQWFGSYLGVAAVLLAFVGFVLLGWRALRRDEAAAALFLVVVPTAVFYVLRPSVYPDQPWAMRRYLPVVIPGVVIAIAVTLTAAWTAAQHRRVALERALALAGVVVLGGLVALPTARAELPLVRARDQQGALAAVRTVCDAVPSDGAILLTGASLFPKDLALEWSQALRAFCGVPTAIPRTYDPPDLPELASQWRAAGRRLFVVSTNPKDDLRRTPGARLAAHVTVPDAYAPVSVFDRRPTRRGPRLRRDISLLTIPAAAR